MKNHHRREPQNALETQNQNISQHYVHHCHLMKKILSTSRAYMKISKAFICKTYYNQEIKNNLISIAETFQLDFFQSLSHSAGKQIIQVICLSNSGLSDHFKQYSNQMQDLHVMYSEMIKDKYEEYKQEKKNVEHYVQKLKSLQKFANNEKNRFERNKQKLKEANSNYKRRMIEIKQLLVKTNQEVQKIWQKNFVCLASAFFQKYQKTINQMKYSFDERDSVEILIDDEDSIKSASNSIKGDFYPDPTFDRIQKFLAPNKSDRERKLVIDLFPINYKSIKLRQIRKQSQKSEKLEKQTKVQQLFGVDFFMSNPSVNKRNTKDQSSFQMFTNILSEQFESKKQEKSSKEIEKFDFDKLNLNWNKGKNMSQVQINLLDL